MIIIMIIVMIIVKIIVSIIVSQVQIMYYAGFRVLPEAPLREDWVQVVMFINMDDTVITLPITETKNDDNYTVKMPFFRGPSYRGSDLILLLESPCSFGTKFAAS